MKHCYHYETPVGVICIGEENGKITALYNDKSYQLLSLEKQKELSLYAEQETETLRKAGQELQEYFAGKRKTFDLELAPEGTEFQQKVWTALQRIPYGQTRSYGEIAKEIGNPKAVRAVGGANHRNPIMIVIPCHRVIGANGSLTGFGGGLGMKEYLLKLEKI